MASPNRTYVSDGQVLERLVDLRSSYSSTDLRYSLPFYARVSRSIDSLYNFFGLYFVSLLSVRIVYGSARLVGLAH
jgi:hypothetical protein